MSADVILVFLFNLFKKHILVDFHLFSGSRQHSLSSSLIISINISFCHTRNLITFLCQANEVKERNAIHRIVCIIYTVGNQMLLLWVSSFVSHDVSLH